jgi:hypothetical protein
MNPEQLREQLVRRPFQPFRVRLKDGRTFDILHPNLGFATESVFIIGIPALDDDNPAYADRSKWISWPQVDTIEPLPKADVPAV